MTHAFARAPPLSIKPEACIRLWSHPVFSSRWVTTAIRHTKNTLKETALTRQARPRISRFCCCSKLPFQQPPPPHPPVESWENFEDNTAESFNSASSKAPLIRVRTPEEKRKKGLNKNRKWNSTSDTTKTTLGGNHDVCRNHRFFDKTRRPPCECRSRWNPNTKGQIWGTPSMNYQNLSGDAVRSRFRAV